MARGFSKVATSQQKNTDSLPSMDILNASFLEHFANLKDPRIERSKEHLLKDIIAIAILAVISGADGWVGIEAYGNAKYEWLKSFLELPNGIPFIKKKGDYILALKGNQKLLHQAVKEWFEEAQKTDYLGRKFNYYEQVEAGHHRVGKRQVWAVDVSELPPLHNQELWSGLKTVVMIVSERRLWNKTTTEARFYA